MFTYLLTLYFERISKAPPSQQRSIKLVVTGDNCNGAKYVFMLHKVRIDNSTELLYFWRIFIMHVLVMNSVIVTKTQQFVNLDVVYKGYIPAGKETPPCSSNPFVFGIVFDNQIVDLFAVAASETYAIQLGYVV